MRAASGGDAEVLTGMKLIRTYQFLITQTVRATRRDAVENDCLLYSQNEANCLDLLLFF